ncbi:hypothetical protein PR048_002096 [Dryococelus australis]|uniref:Uncharacterized protein n=1 Tax=Dryococelus australis TaxID=614101 RepID=A0ABQ9IKC2_9NEOP|nr:hypothetical protein PR048_002096 [Dryococelus australis]
MDCSKSVKTPAVAVSKNLEDNKPKESRKFPYREAVRSLLYLSNKTRTDITYAVNMVSRKTTNQTIEDVQSFKIIFIYLQNTQNLGLWYSSQDNTTVIDAYSDADYASDTYRRSTSGYIIMYAGGPISLSTSHQPVASLSTAESEFIAAS